MTPSPVFVLGGHQTDFARNWTREGLELSDLVDETVHGTLADAGVAASEVDVVHVANFAAERYQEQGHLGGFPAEVEPGLRGVPASRHEAACASGSVAVLAAMADLESGRYGTALVVGVELMRVLPAFEAQAELGAAAWVPHETRGIAYPWADVFARLGDEYDRRYGLDPDHLTALARSNFTNARRNPRAQTRRWTLDEDAFVRGSEPNPTVAGVLCRNDCSQVTDGGAGVVLASGEAASAWAASRGRSLDEVPRIAGWGHRTARISFEGKLADAVDDPYVFPHVRRAALDALGRAGIADARDLDLLETHDCFTTTHYAAIDHIGITGPGESWKAIEDGYVMADGPLPINPSGGLMGGGHPVGATGVRMLLDASRQVAGAAGETQVEGARRAATLNIGGSATTVAAFVVERG